MRPARPLAALSLAVGLVACGDASPVPDAVVERIADRLEEWNCAVDEDEVERADEGYEAEADCPDGEYEIVLDADLEVVSMERY
ncbi:MAG: PepSY domain-containing protein [Paracoccaceae bacterium]